MAIRDGRIHPGDGKWKKKILMGEDYQVMGIWGAGILPIWAFFKANKKNILNIEHWLKSKLAWPVYKY